MSWEIIISILGSFGGLELIKWIYNRKPTLQKVKAEATSAEVEAEKSEISALRDTIEAMREAIQAKHGNNEWLQQQLQAKEERFAEQTQLVRKLNGEVLELTHKLSEETFAHRMDECQDRDCPFRQPPKPYTPPKDDCSKKEYFSSQSKGEQKTNSK